VSAIDTTTEQGRFFFDFISHIVLPLSIALQTSLQERFQRYWAICATYLVRTYGSPDCSGRPRSEQSNNVSHVRLLCYTALDIMDNLLTGTVPTELGKCSMLGNLLLALNDLTGSVPEEVCSLFTPPDESKEIMVDCKEVQCTCNCTCDNPYDSLLTL
jgi:hypothetical protein